MTAEALATNGAFRGVVTRLRVAASTVVAAVLGVAPHVLHHVGPLAAAALLGGDESPPAASPQPAGHQEHHR